MQECIHTFKCLDTVITTIELRFIEGILYGVDAYSGEVGFAVRFGENHLEVSPAVGSLSLAHVIERGDVDEKIDRLLDTLKTVLSTSTCEEYSGVVER